MSCDVGEATKRLENEAATEGLENELWCGWSDEKLENDASPTSQLILQTFRSFTYSQALHLRHLASRPCNMSQHLSSDPWRLFFFFCVKGKFSLICDTSRCIWNSWSMFIKSGMRIAWWQFIWKGYIFRWSQRGLQFINLWRLTRGIPVILDLSLSQRCKDMPVIKPLVVYWSLIRAWLIFHGFNSSSTYNHKNII